MSDLFVGGVRGFQKSINDQVNKSKLGDTIFLNTDQYLNEMAMLNKNIIIDGQGKNITINKNIVGFFLESSCNVTFKNIIFSIHEICNVVSISEKHSGTVTFQNVKFSYHKSIDSRDWVTPIANSSNETQIKFQSVDVPYIECLAKQIEIVDSSIGSIFSKPSQILCLVGEGKRVILDNTYFKSMYKDYQCSLQFHDVYSSGLLSLSECNGSIDEITFLELEDQKGRVITTNKMFRKAFTNEYFIPPNNVIPLLSLIKAGENTQPFKVSRVKVENTNHTIYQNQLFILNQSTIIIENSMIESLSLKNYIDNTELSFSQTIDKSQWQVGNNVKVSILNSKTELSHLSNEKNALEKLNEYIGLEGVKNSLKQSVAVAKMNSERKTRGLKESSGFSMHMIFTGSAGTGKTTMAKLYGQALYENGVLPSSNFLLATRKDLVAEYVGQTANKTHELIQSARGGVLFIDEAYSLIPKGDNDFSQEAIDQLVADSEEYRDDLVIILAGYTKDMEELIETNEGLASRFKQKIEFPNYSMEELMAILLMIMKGQGIILNQKSKKEVLQSFKNIYLAIAENDGISGNARFVRNYVQDLITRRDLRISMKENINNDDLTSLAINDIKDVEQNYI